METIQVFGPFRAFRTVKTTIERHPSCCMYVVLALSFLKERRRKYSLAIPMARSSEK